MAVFLPVAPANYLEHILTKQTRSDRNAFLLAHEVVADPEGYARVAKLWEGCGGVRILDNSVIELGGAVDLKMVKEAHAIAPTRVVVLPDVLEDGPATLDLALSQYGMWRDAFAYNTELMFVPQGADLLDWITCLERFMDAVKEHKPGGAPAWIGIPRNTVGRIVPSRKMLVDLVKMLYPSKQIHLLGFSDFMFDDMLSARGGWVRSIDSAVPFRCGDIHIHSAIPKRGDWWETAKEKAQEELPDWILGNVQKLNGWVA